MADFTLLANCTASSPSCSHGMRRGCHTRGRVRVCVCVHTCQTHLLVHGRQVPNVADDGPAGHHPQQIADHVVLTAVPEGIPKLGVVLQDHRHAASYHYHGIMQLSHAQMHTASCSIIHHHITITALFHRHKMLYNAQITYCILPV